LPDDLAAFIDFVILVAVFTLLPGVPLLGDFFIGMDFEIMAAVTFAAAELPSLLEGISGVSPDVNLSRNLTIDAFLEPSETMASILNSSLKAVSLLLKEAKVSVNFRTVSLVSCIGLVNEVGLLDLSFLVTVAAMATANFPLCAR
jgi:hypothetical protein